MIILYKCTEDQKELETIFSGDKLKQTLLKEYPYYMEMHCK